jgi:hypothetical protein
VKLKDKKGNPLFEKLEVKFIVGDTVKKRVMKAPAPPYYTEENIQAQLELIADELEKKFPQVNWRMAELGPDRFNFIGEERARPAPLAEKPAEGYSVPDRLGKS